MQNNVNAQCVIDKMVYYFGDDNVQTCDGGIIKLQVKEFTNDIKHVTDCLVYANVQIKRGGKGITVLFIPRVDEATYSPEMNRAIDRTWYAATHDLWTDKPTNSLRHYFETRLPQEARMAAFNNTPKSRWDEEHTDFTVAMTKAFEWGNSPQGYDYWENVVNSCLIQD